MRLEEGGSMAKLLYPPEGTLKTHLNETQKIGILREVAEALRALHAVGCIHGDIKPANILLRDLSEFTVRLADFGLSEIREVREAGQQSSTLQSTMHTKGTKLYCAPEMLHNPLQASASSSVSKASRRTDIYAFAVLAWELLADEKPFTEAGNIESKLLTMVHSNQRPDLDILRRKGVPPAITDTISKCWSGDRDERLTAIQSSAVFSRVHSALRSQVFNIFLSHAWRNKPLLSCVFALLADMGYRVWYDEKEMGFDLDSSMREGIEKSEVVLCCANSLYQSRSNCMFEVEQAVAKKKTVVAVLLENPFQNNSWATTRGPVPVDSKLSDALAFKKKLFVDISAEATKDKYRAVEDGGDESLWPTAPTAELVQALQPLVKILADLKVKTSLLRS
jgi:serine/threonine protein kinase